MAVGTYNLLLFDILFCYSLVDCGLTSWHHGSNAECHFHDLLVCEHLNRDVHPTFQNRVDNLVNSFTPCFLTLTTSKYYMLYVFLFCCVYVVLWLVRKGNLFGTFLPDHMIGALVSVRHHLFNIDRDFIFTPCNNTPTECPKFRTFDNISQLLSVLSLYVVLITLYLGLNIIKFSWTFFLLFGKVTRSNAGRRWFIVAVWKSWLRQRFWPTPSAFLVRVRKR